MVKVLVNDNKGLVQYSNASGLQVENAIYTAGSAVAAVATTGAPLPSQLVALVTSDGNTKRVTLPLASGPGQMIFVVETAGTNSAVVRNNANDATVATVTADAYCLCVSTAAGDNWKGVPSI